MTTDLVPCGLFVMSVMMKVTMIRLLVLVRAMIIRIMIMKT